MKELDVDEVTERYSYDYLRELSTFGALTDDCIQLLLQEGRTFELNAGETLYEAGTSADEFYVILDGTLDLFHHSKGKWAPTRTYHPGEQLGFVGIIALHPHHGTAVACERSLILAINGRQFFTLNDTDPHSFGVLMINLSRGMARTITMLADIITELQH